MSKQDQIEFYKEKLKDKLALPITKLSIGSGLHWKQPFEEWINHDGLPSEHCDVISEFAELPFEDKTFDEVHFGDICEHVVCWREKEIWTEWNRVMKIGALMTGSTPNLHRVMIDYAEGRMTLEIALQNIYAWRTTPYEQHYITYTVATLTELLKKYGFDEISFEGSPGVDGNPDKNMAWWLVWSAKKVRGVQ